MNIQEIKETVDLLKKANCQDYVTLTELAKELKVSKVKIVSFLDQNEKLFHLTQRWQPKEKRVTTTFQGRKYKETIQVKGKNLGICIDNAFLKLEDNWKTDEWLELMKIEKAKTVHISEWSNYGWIEGYYFELDREEHEFRYHLWRNTPEKLKILQDLGVFGERTYSIGGFGDSSSHKITTAIGEKGLQILKKEGWQFNQLKEISK